VPRGPLKVKEIEQAAVEIVKITQREASINKQSSKERFAKLSPVISEDIVKVGGKVVITRRVEASCHSSLQPPRHEAYRALLSRERRSRWNNPNLSSNSTEILDRERAKHGKEYH
jgi:hypothetical protein